MAHRGVPGHSCDAAGEDGGAASASVVLYRTAFIMLSVKLSYLKVADDNGKSEASELGKCQRAGFCGPALKREYSRLSVAITAREGTGQVF